MRIAIAEVKQETDTFSPIPYELEDFKEGGLYFGKEIVEKMRGVERIGGLLAVAEDEVPEAEFWPIVRARSGPGGRVTTDTLEFLERKLVSGLKEGGSLDGVFLPLHGAGASEKADDLEGYLLAAARRVVGDDVPIVVPLDHHANITRLIMETADVVVGDRTNPHDPFDTGVRAARILFGMLRGEISPTAAWQKIPMLALADKYVTAEWPLKEWIDLAREMEERPGVVSVSTFPMQPWLDVPEAGWTAVVYTDDDPCLAQELAAELANKAWALREKMWELDRLSPQEAIRQAVAAVEGPIVLTDSGDCVSSGAPGDSTCLLKEMLKQNVGGPAFMTMFDPEVVELALAAGVGSEVTALVGGKRDNMFSHPVEVTGTVMAVSEGLRIKVFGEAFGFLDLGRTALLEIGGIRMVVGDKRLTLTGMYPIIYRHLGLEPTEAKIIVVKTQCNVHHYRSFMKAHLRVDSPGTTGDLRRLNWTRVPRPIYPLDDLSEWRAVPAGATSRS